MKKMYVVMLFVLICFITGCRENQDTEKLSVVSTIFPGYDFARAIGTENIELTMLIKPGTESHSYDPTPKDIVKIQKSDVFIYVGGESEEWVADILEGLDSHTKVIRMMDLVEVKEEEIIEGMEHEEEHDHEEEHEYDEHIWTSPINAIKIVEHIKKSLIQIDPENEINYTENASSYILKLQELDQEIREIVTNSTRKEIVFADRFPFRYFVDEYGLHYRAAFPGCSSDTEASAKTIAYLVDYIKENTVPVVFYIELSNQKVANTLIEETPAKKLEFQSIHNVTKEQFDQHITYIDIMKQNINNLKEALK